MGQPAATDSTRAACGPVSGIPAAYVYSWGPRGNMPGALDRKGQRCQVRARGALNSALVEFEDGCQEVVSRNALRRAKGGVA